MSRAARWFLFVAFAAASSAATTATWEINGYQDFLRGRSSGLSITPDGRVSLGPKIDTFYSSDQAQIWSAASAPDGSLYLGTGNRGRLIKVDASGKATVVWSADQPEIFAVAVDRQGVVYAGTSPDGKIYRIENGKASEFFSPGETYIWALAFGPDGALYAATGQQGKIFKVSAPGKGELYYETGQAHVTALAFDREGRLLAGSEPNGILYRITNRKGFVLYDANLPEIRAIVPAADGSIYATALGGSLAKRTAAASNASNSSSTILTAPATSITVTDAQSGLSTTPKPDPAKPATPSSPISAPASTTEVSGVERSALYKILPDNTVEALWSSKEEDIYDLAVEPDGTLLFLTEGQGRVYRMDQRSSRVHSATLIAQTNETDATRLIAFNQGFLIAAGNTGKLLRLGNGAAKASVADGWLESPVHDAGSVARWGRLQWTGDSRGVAFKTRAGNSARPDGTWSDWSDAIADPAKSTITSPNARFLQWRAEFTRVSADPMPAIDSVTVAYLPQNTPPAVRSITVSALAPSASSGAKSSPTAASAPFSITVTDTGDATPAAGTQAQTLSRPAGQQIQVSWQADDPDGDKLAYSLYFRGEEEREWKLLRADISENTYLLDGDVLADGRYFFRVVASDRPANSADQAREAELTGPPVLIDNTPPLVKPGLPRRSGTALEIDVDAEDAASSLRRCEFSVDASTWQPVEAVDGVTDSPREQFRIRVASLPPGEHLIVIRAYDAAGNAGLAKVVVR